MVALTAKACALRSASCMARRKLIAPHALFEPIEIDALLLTVRRRRICYCVHTPCHGARKARRVCMVPSCVVPQTPLTRRWSRCFAQRVCVLVRARVASNAHWRGRCS
eukprot:IDg6192t1